MQHLQVFQTFVQVKIVPKKFGWPLYLIKLLSILFLSVLKITSKGLDELEKFWDIFRGWKVFFSWVALLIDIKPEKNQGKNFEHKITSITKRD